MIFRTNLRFVKERFEQKSTFRNKHPEKGAGKVKAKTDANYKQKKES